MPNNAILGLISAETVVTIFRSFRIAMRSAAAALSDVRETRFNLGRVRMSLKSQTTMIAVGKTLKLEKRRKEKIPSRREEKTTITFFRQLFNTKNKIIMRPN